jgi:SpoIIAA-like
LVWAGSKVSPQDPRKTVLKLIEDLPPTVLGIEASGKITHEDYLNVLIPNAEAMMAKGPIKMLYVIGDDFTGFELGALWDDGAFGLKHWHDFSCIAVVADHAWLRGAVSMFKPFFPHEVQLFRLSDLAAAKAWLTGAEGASSTTASR